VEGGEWRVEGGGWRVEGGGGWVEGGGGWRMDKGGKDPYIVNLVSKSIMTKHFECYFGVRHYGVAC
jgi:hypothetical protein